MDDAKLRAWWWRRQGLDGSFDGHDPAALLARSGWARSVGGAGPYISLFARGGLSREQIDEATAAVQIHELPSARGCTYVLPACDFALGLRAGHAFAGGEMKTALKLGVTETEVGNLCDAVLTALQSGPLDPEQLKQAVGAAARSLGADGTKKGVTSTMPVALGKLQAAGEIRRIAVNGRLDQQRYRYTLWRPHPLAGSQMSPEEAYTLLAERYFRWIGPATLTEFQWFSGLGSKAAKAAIQSLDLAPVAPESDRLMFPADLDAFSEFRVPKQPHYSLIMGLDSFVLLRRDLSQLIAMEDRDREVQTEKGRTAMNALSDLPSHPIIDGGRIVGLWEYDLTSGTIAWSPFTKPDREMKEAVARTEEYVRTQLGDARSFSLDSPKSRTPRIEALRAAVRA